jgi:anhydro-N-acetylmuramic acid kinase
MNNLNPDQNELHYTVIGLMSGTSLDGVDLACCTFTKSVQGWSYSIEKAATYPYPASWISKLPKLLKADAFTYAKANSDLGKYLGYLISSFVKQYKLSPDFVASHGHTIFHQPDIGLTTQIGSGAVIAAECGLPVVCDFRSSDVAYHGQGAPLVPIGDRLLFKDYRFCLNLGGFSNVSYQDNDQTIAFDVCPVNTILNRFARMQGFEYDKGGAIARSGRVDAKLLADLNELEYYKQSPPKSLGFEWSDEYVLPLIEESSLSVPDLLCTFVEHVAVQISMALVSFPPATLLITGGGAKNTYLIERLQAYTPHAITIPSPTIIDYKEALIFAFLGVLRMRGEANCLSSVTGATKDAIGGAVYLP